LISKHEINGILSKYGEGKISIGTICSHSALQIFHGAKLEGFKTVGICTRDRISVYKSFPEAQPDEFIVVDNFKDILEPKCQEIIRSKNMIIIPHGSFVEYVGPKNLEDKFCVPMFGNRKTLKWEQSRDKQRHWIESASLKLPKQYRDPSEIDGKVFVKLPGAKGGRGFFTASSDEELHRKLDDKMKAGIIGKEDSLNMAIQEFIPGVRYYPHYFYSLFADTVGQVDEGRVELLSMDKRIEPIDEAYRGLPNIPEEFFDYTVTGNQPVVVRESLLLDMMHMGVSTVKASTNLFYPGMLGPFCLEVIYHPNRGFIVFEISARIVAGTNLYPQGSPYSCYLFKESMSTGRRIAKEIKLGIKEQELERIIY
jgi:5-formaminoimidazole-4-carboxamide-1-(beta)-D-ribofuranosyl 5'-monophosphate synthetase